MRIKLLVVVIIASLLILAVQTAQPSSNVEAQANANDWLQFQHDPQRTGRTNLAVPPNYKLKWAWFDKNHVVKDFVSAPNKSITDGFGAGFQITTTIPEMVQPIIAEGRAFFGSMQGVMNALDASAGNQLWEYATGGPIMGTAAYSNGAIIFGSMDGKVYALNATNGQVKWTYTTGAGVSAALMVNQGNVYFGSRDGKFYALDAASGALKWSYTTKVPTSDNQAFNQAPIFAPAVLSEDGATIMFGAENMYFYALNANTGLERWSKKLVGQSFHTAWPVVKGNNVFLTTMSSLEGAEFLMESVLDALPADPTWAEEKAAVMNWLNQNPNQKIMYAIDVNTGLEPYQIAMGRVTGNNDTPFPPVVDNKGKLLVYWRSKKSSFIPSKPCFGTKYCPDISQLDPTTGDRIKLPVTTTVAPELDNGFGLTTGGDYLYMLNPFRGVHVINLNTGADTWVSANIARWDCANYRNWGAKFIYYGNDSVSTDCPAPSSPMPPRVSENSTGQGTISLASPAGRPMMFINETNAGAVVAYESQ